jgi:hypothetical protein
VLKWNLLGITAVVRMSVRLHRTDSAAAAQGRWDEDANFSCRMQHASLSNGPDGAGAVGY